MEKIYNNWYKIKSPKELIQGMKIAFTTKGDEPNITEFWNESFTLLSCTPNSNGQIELSLLTNDNEKLIVYLNEIDKLYMCLEEK